MYLKQPKDVTSAARPSLHTDKAGEDLVIPGPTRPATSHHFNVCQLIQFTGVKYSFFFIILGGYGHIGKWIQENIIFMRSCCFKLSKKIEKLSNKETTHAIAKCTLTGLVQ